MRSCAFFNDSLTILDVCTFCQTLFHNLFTILKKLQNEFYFSNINKSSNVSFVYLSNNFIISMTPRRSSELNISPPSPLRAPTPPEQSPTGGGQNRRKKSREDSFLSSIFGSSS